VSFTLLDTPTVGLPDLQRAAFYVFFEGMNNAQQEIDAYWQPLDQRFNTVTGRNIPPVTMEPIPASNFHEGHKPSLVLGTPDTYPNLSVFAMRADPSAQSPSADNFEAWDDQISVEVMVKGTSEDETNRRIQRMADAVVLCLRRNPDLGGAIIGEISQPAVMISDLFKVRSPGQGGAYGETYVWQGAQISFRVRKDSVRPSSGPGTFAEASQVDYSQFIDQG
jgi:hypothetical protein